MPEPVLVYTTWPSAEAALDAGRALVTRGFCACVNILPGALSVYRWEDAIEADAEAIMIIKTRTDQIVALQAEVSALHPYDMPAFLALPVDRSQSSAPYLSWLMAMSAPPGAS
jgi:periplasmic divalent cation tolerance protein